MRGGSTECIQVRDIRCELAIAAARSSAGFPEKGRCLYAYRPTVAMHRRDHRPVFSRHCVVHHSGAIEAKFFGFLERYPTRCRSKRAKYLGHLTQERTINQCTFPQAVAVRSRRCRTNRRRPSCADYGLSSAVPNLLQDIRDLKKPLVDVVQRPSEADTGNQKNPEVPSHTTLPNSAGAYVPAIFLAESHFTGRTPRPATITPAGAA